VHWSAELQKKFTTQGVKDQPVNQASEFRARSLNSYFAFLQNSHKKLEMKLEYEKKPEEFKKGKQGNSNGSLAKLPKLSKFDGTSAQWLSLWNKFCAEIDSTDLLPVTKFAYLKELLLPKVRVDIDGLPFSSEWL